MPFSSVATGSLVAEILTTWFTANTVCRELDSTYTSFQSKLSVIMLDFIFFLGSRKGRYADPSPTEAAPWQSIPAQAVHVRLCLLVGLCNVHVK